MAQDKGVLARALAAAAFSQLGPAPYSEGVVKIVCDAAEDAVKHFWTQHAVRSETAKALALASATLVDETNGRASGTSLLKRVHELTLTNHPTEYGVVNKKIKMLFKGEDGDEPIDTGCDTVGSGRSAAATADVTGDATSAPNW